MIGPLISAGASLIGGFLNSKSQKDANAINAQNAQNNINLQREFAQNAIQWKAADAEKAGIHPAFAMGANTTSFSPVTVGAQPVSGIGNALAGMGQNISRAVSAPAAPAAKVGGALVAQQATSNALDLETKSLNNQYLRAKLAALTQPATPPGVAFDVPENKKIEERPPLMMAGKRWDTNPDTSPMKAWEDQYGDDGIASWVLPPILAARDAGYNFRKKYGINQETAGTDFIQKFGASHAQLARWYQAARSRLMLNN